MTDEELTLAHILDHLARRSSLHREKAPSRNDVLANWLKKYPEWDDPFFVYLKNEFKIELDATDKDKIRSMSLKSIAFYISRVRNLIPR